MSAEQDPIMQREDELIMAGLRDLAASGQQPSFPWPVERDIRDVLPARPVSDTEEQLMLALDTYGPEAIAGGITRETVKEALRLTPLMSPDPCIIFNITPEQAERARQAMAEFMREPHNPNWMLKEVRDVQGEDGLLHQHQC